MIRFYLPGWKKGEQTELPESESNHCVNVLRHQEGDVIYGVDGKGHLLECSILTADPGAAIVQVEEVIQHQPYPAFRLELVVAPTKQMNRMEWMVEKCTEIGIRKISFLLTRYGERPSISKRERLERKMLSAMKQSRRLWLPELEGMRSLEDVLEEVEDYHGQTIVASSERESPWIGSVLDTKLPTRIIVGPEGGFHEDELEQFDDYDISSVNLGSSILRTETAGVYLSSIWSYMMQEQ